MFWVVFETIQEFESSIHDNTEIRVDCRDVDEIAY